MLTGLLQGHVDGPVNLVNATSLAEDRGIVWRETSSPRARDYTNRLSVRANGVSLSGTTIGTTSRPRLVEAFDQEIEIEMAPHIGLFRYRDVPGQIGRVGSILGEAKVNIGTAAVSRSSVEGDAVMGVTVDSPVPQAVADRIAALDGFAAAWFVDLGD